MEKPAHLLACCSAWLMCMDWSWSDILAVYARLGLLFVLDVMEVSLLNLFHLVVKYSLKKIGDLPPYLLGLESCILT